ncbi:hypothetical protein MRX96_016942 [Rhipicephalus microplus]
MLSTAHTMATMRRRKTTARKRSTRSASGAARKVTRSSIRTEGSDAREWFSHNESGPQPQQERESGATLFDSHCLKAERAPGTTCSNGIRRHDSTDGSDGVWASRRVASRKSTRNRLCDVSPSGNCIAHGRSSCLRLAGPAQCRRRATCSRTSNSAS